MNSIKTEKNKILTIKTLILLIIILCSSLIIFTSYSKNSYLEVHVIDVDQGDSCLIITPEKKSILIDGGKEKFARNVIREIKKSGTDSIDYVIGTHYDEDHIGGLNIILSEIKAHSILFPIDNSLPPELTEIIYLCKLKKTPVYKVKSNDTIKIDNSTKLHILSPDRQYEDSNQNSIVFILEYLNNYLMFTGDADETIEKNIISKYKLPKCKFLKVGHHGSKHSSSQEFLNTISPEISIISCGYKNSYGHPHDEVITKLKNINSKIYRTDVNGTMIFYFDKKDVFSEGKYAFVN